MNRDLFSDIQAATSDGDKPKKAGKSSRDWDAVAKEADEIQEGDPLNNLFQKIFSEANDDTRRAMIKSFVSLLILISVMFHRDNLLQWVNTSASQSEMYPCYLVLCSIPPPPS